MQQNVVPADSGYKLPDDAGRKLVLDYGNTSLVKSVVHYLSFNSQLIAFAVAGAWIIEHANAGVAALALLLLGVLASRAFRGFENMVHEASHWNLSRGSRWANEFLGDKLCGAAALHILSEYREDHDNHHLYFASDIDPDKIKYRELGVDKLPRLTRERRYGAVLHVAALYWRLQLRKFFRPRLGIRFALWFGILVLLPSLAVLRHIGEVRAVPLAVVALVFLVLSPLVRLIAEASEHDYLNPRTTFDSTYTNLGVFEFFFPLNDCFHLLHHLVPTIPFWSLRQANFFLANQDRPIFGLRSLKRGPEKRFFS